MSTCSDCLYFLPIDVFKGMCKIDKRELAPEDASCNRFERVRKCKFCTEYSEDKDYLGKCRGTSVAWPDMNANHCSDFKWQNPS